jgi:4-hydroxy-L-threonine phosphate dehydrogenase PdxA
MKNKIILIAGDPNSINSEIIFKSFKKLSKSLKNRIYLIGSYDLISQQLRKLNFNLKLEEIDNIKEVNKGSSLKIININIKFKNPFKVERNEASKYVLKSLNLAHKIAVEEKVAGIINCPINKNLLNKKRIGVTEYFAKKCQINDNSEVMLIHNKKLSVAPLTTHIDIKNVSKNINAKNIIKKTKTIEKWFKINLNKKPNIGVLGLNPHNSEMRNGSEEKRIINPVILKLRKAGIKISGPLVSDSIFINNYKKFDVIMGMYHDQVLSPFKALFKFDAINITLGLKYFRASPDHGTAYNIIKKKKANETSLLNCINYIHKFQK